MKSIFQVMSVFLIVFISCSKTDTDSNIFTFNERDYKLIDTKKDDLGNKSSEDYVCNYDKNISLKKIYWENGKIQSITFFNKGKLFGPNQYYGVNGDMLYNGFYYNDKETGIIIEYNSETKKAKIKVYKDGDVVNQTDLK